MLILRGMNISTLNLHHHRPPVNSLIPLNLPVDTADRCSILVVTASDL